MNVTQEIKLPGYLINHIRELAESEGVTVDQFIASAVAEKAATWTSTDYLEERSKRSSREKFLSAMSQIPATEPDPWDRMD